MTSWFIVCCYSISGWTCLFLWFMSSVCSCTWWLTTIALYTLDFLKFWVVTLSFFWFIASEFWCWGWCSIRGATSDVRREIVLTNPCQMTDRQNGYRDADDICCVEKLPMPKNDVEWWLPKASWFMLSFRINDAGRCWKLYKVKSFDVKIENTLCTWPIKS